MPSRWNGNKRFALYAYLYSVYVCTFALRRRSLRWKNKSKHCSGWFVVREKHCSKLKNMDYNPSQQADASTVDTVNNCSVSAHRQSRFPLLVSPRGCCLPSWLVQLFCYCEICDTRQYTASVLLHSFGSDSVPRPVRWTGFACDTSYEWVARPKFDDTR